MAFVAGKNSYLSVDNTSGTLTDISSYTDSVDGLPGDYDNEDVTAFGDSGHKIIPTLENSQFSASGSWDSALDAILGASRTTARTFEWGPAGNTSGNVKYSGECYIVSYSTSASATGKVTWSATLRVDGTVTRGTFA